MTTAAPARGRQHRWSGALWVLPAFTIYAAFVLYPLVDTVRYSLFDWDGVGVARWVGLANYAAVFTQPDLFGSIANAFVLMVFFVVFPILIGLSAAILIQDIRSGAFSAIARVLMFIPQIIPLAGAAIVWVWIYSSDGPLNGVLRAVGLENATRPWLGEFETALAAVGIIGTWVASGLCTLLFSAGIGRIDPSLFEAAALDGAGRIRRARAITLPALRSEVVVAATLLMIATLSSFDIIYVATAGGPGYTTMVPGVLIYRLVFTSQEVGLASALGVVLTVLILAIVVPTQLLGRRR
ncbi:MAG: sugar ABC transporter permease [Microbacterium sp.]